MPRQCKKMNLGNNSPAFIFIFFLMGRTGLKMDHYIHIERMERARILLARLYPTIYARLMAGEAILPVSPRSTTPGVINVSTPLIRLKVYYSFAFPDIFKSVFPDYPMHTQKDVDRLDKDYARELRKANIANEREFKRALRMIKRGELDFNRIVT